MIIAFDLRNVCLVEMLYGCGLRISEALALDLGDVDLRRRTVVVRESKHGQTRVVPLPGAARSALETYRSAAEPQPKPLSTRPRC